MRAGRLGDPRGFRHPARLAAGKLNDVRPVTGGFAAKHGHRTPADEIVARGHFGYDERRPQRFGKVPERPVRDPRHRRKKNAVADGNISNRERSET
ncbi:hypothetical protein NWI01_26170 [Nitrobacter winogradskyi]|uniref:Uncharacterized protein n=1 Tax=Nitrobacter winogradskyi TaxID=913 RepID=A0A4Y3WDL6_NITWI|nr:hypothetical protein NWI01_26170 [Nitrobacter winogradskyi]